MKSCGCYRVGRVGFIILKQASLCLRWELQPLKEGSLLESCGSLETGVGTATVI